MLEYPGKSGSPGNVKILYQKPNRIMLCKPKRKFYLNVYGYYFLHGYFIVDMALSSTEYIIKYKIIGELLKIWEKIFDIYISLNLLSKVIKNQTMLIVFPILFKV